MPGIPLREACGAVVVLVALLVACGAEPVGPSPETNTAQAENGRIVIEEVLATYRAATAYSHVCTWATVTTTGDDAEPWASDQGAPTRFLFERPDRFVVESPDSAVYCDGETLWTVDRERDESMETPLAEVHPPPLAFMGAVEIEYPAAAAVHMLLVGVEDPAEEPVEPLLAEDATYSVDEQVRGDLDGRWVRVTPSPSEGSVRVALWVENDTGLVLAWEITSSGEMAGPNGTMEPFQTRISISCREVELDPDISDDAFRFTPGPDTRRVEPDSEPEAG